MGIVLVTVILLMFLSNVRSAVIVAINIPLALLFAFAVLFLRGKSANLLSIGAVDFGIIVDSSVIMVENIYRHLSSGDHAELPLKERIFQGLQRGRQGRCSSRRRSWSAPSCRCSRCRGRKGRSSAPMADTYAFALGGALLLALTLSPVLCLLFFKQRQAGAGQLPGPFLKNGYLRHLGHCLRHRWITLGSDGRLCSLVTVAVPLRNMGREFMPELEEGNLWIRAIFPVHVSLDAVAEPGSAQGARTSWASSAYPEVGAVVVQAGRPDDGTDPGGFNNVEFFVPLPRRTGRP